MIKLDWIGMKVYHKRFVIIPLMVCFYGIFNVPVIIPIVAFCMLNFSVNPFAVEEKGKLDNLYLTLPVTRKAIVNARFGLSLLMQCIGLAAGTVITIILSNVLYGRTVFHYTHTFKADFAVIFLLICGSLLLYAVMNLSIFPILFKIGYAKGKMFGFIIPVFAVSIMTGVLFTMWYSHNGFREWLLSVIEWSLAHTVWTALILLGASALLLAVSYMLSRKVYAKREF
ncbi:MAG: ABC-2 transporter permease [Oscillospiraceae bacterium]|nr:ABC-2 transporter permease [Oscillospiraceae bacterium]